MSNTAKGTATIEGYPVLHVAEDWAVFDDHVEVNNDEEQGIETIRVLPNASENMKKSQRRGFDSYWVAQANPIKFNSSDPYVTDHSDSSSSSAISCYTDEPSLLTAEEEKKLGVKWWSFLCVVALLIAGAGFGTSYAVTRATSKGSESEYSNGVEPDESLPPPSLDSNDGSTFDSNDALSSSTEDDHSSDYGISSEDVQSVIDEEDNMDWNQKTPAPITQPTKVPTTQPTRAPTAQPTKVPTAQPSSVPTEEVYRGPLVGVYYIPQGDNNFYDGDYFRGKLDPPQYPALGEYKSSDTLVISKHLQWTRGANINLWVLNWEGPESASDITAKGSIMKHPELPGTQISFMYDARSRSTATDDTLSLDHIYGDIDYMAKTYFNDPNYLRINGHPVVYLYISRWLDANGILESAIDLMRLAGDDNGHDIYIVGDHAFANPPTDTSYNPFEVLDAVTNVDIYGSMGMPRYAQKSGVAAYKLKQSGWKDAAAFEGCAYIPTVTTGFNDRAIPERNLGNPAMSRRISPNEPVGSLFQALLDDAMDLVDESTGNIIMINSWNDWEEDTQMEPVISVGDSDAVSIFQPSSLTQNLIYNSYGELFLDIVRSTTWERDVIIPEEPPLPFPEYNGPLTVGVYYYPWHGDGEFHGREYLRGELEPPQEPLLGEYDDRDPAVVGQHLAWSRDAGVNLWVTSWWGPNDRTDITTRDVIMKHEDLPGTKIALFYETMRLARGATEDEKFKLDAVYPEFKYMAETYFGSEHYYKIDGRPVVYAYLARVLHREGFLETFIDLAKRAAMENGGYDLYVVGDFAFKYPSYDSYGGFDSLDAVTNYDMYGSLDRPRFVGEEGLETYKSSQNAWRAAAKSHGGCDFVPALGPGYNDRGVRLQRGHKAMSRKLSADKPDGSLFSSLLPNAFNLADSDTGGMVMINSWNEWHEDSQIEPVVDFGNTTEPSELTQNLAYPAYGSQYLDILRNAVEVFEGKNI